MTDIRKVRALIEYVAGEVDSDIELDDVTIAVVLYVLDSHNLLRDFEGEPEWYHLRVQVAWRDALRMLFPDAD